MLYICVSVPANIKNAVYHCSVPANIIYIYIYYTFIQTHISPGVCDGTTTTLTQRRSAGTVPEATCSLINTRPPSPHLSNSATRTNASGCARERQRGFECVWARLRKSGTVHVSVHARARAHLCRPAHAGSQHQRQRCAARRGRSRVWGLGFRV